MKSIVLAVVGLMSMGAAQLASASLITNGGFEDCTGAIPDFGNPTGWVTTGNAICRSNGPLTPNTGSYIAAVRNSGGTFSQDVTFVATGSYLLSFFLGSYGATGDIVIDVDFGSLLDTSITLTDDGRAIGGVSAGVWTEHTYVLDVLAPLTATLSFSDLGTTDSRDPGIDDVSVTLLPDSGTVPAPGTIALLAVGLLTLRRKFC